MGLSSEAAQHFELREVRRAGVVGLRFPLRGVTGALLGIGTMSLQLSSEAGQDAEGHTQKDSDYAIGSMRNSNSR
jgi:hypothetical protein